MKQYCKRCKTSASPKLANKGPHIGAYCRTCGQWCAWIDKTTAAGWPELYRVNEEQTTDTR